MRVAIEYRPQFKPLFVDAPRFQVVVAHRRAGKTVAVLQRLVNGALTCPLPNPRFAFIAPLHKQAKLVAWDYAKSLSRSIMGSKVNEAELRIDYPNGARLQLHGSDNPDALRGQYLDGAAMDEVAQMDPATWGEVVRPALSDRQGWAVFIGTPKGKNLFHRLYEQSKDLPGWGNVFLPASQTGLLSKEELAAARREMTPEEYEQEYELSWTAAIKGAFYGKEMAAAERDGRLCRVPYDPAFQVITSWDLGMRDATAIWFLQHVGRAIHVIDYYEHSGVGLDHYAKVLKDKGYAYAEHIGPHDIEVTELGSGRSRIDTARSLGLNFTVAPRQSPTDGINALRTLIPRMYFDRERCARGIEALTQYRQEWDGKLQALRANPLHDWTSHAADALRYYAVTPVDLEPWHSDWSEPLTFNTGAL